VLLLLLLVSVDSCSSAGSVSSLAVVAGFSLDSLAASSAGLGGVNRIRCAFSVAWYDPGLVLLLLQAVVAAAAAAVPSVGVVVRELVLLLASPVTRLGSVVDGRVPAASSTACWLLLRVFGWSSPGII